MQDFTVHLPTFIKPLKKTILGVSLIHGRLRALSVVKDQVVENWECPQFVENSEQLQTALREAVKETKFLGQKVSFLIDDSRFVHQYLQVPAMKIADLRLYLTTAVEEMKTWKGPTVWRFRTTQEARGKMGVLLDIWPQSFLDELVMICQELELTPVQIAPFSATFVEQVRSLPLENDDVVLFVTLMSDKIALLVAKGDGTPLFERFLSPTCEGVDSSERIGREVTRSILFCAQQFGFNITQVWMAGESSSVTVENVQPFVGLPIRENLMSPDPSYWIWVSLSLPVRSPSNFSSYQIRLGSVRKVMMKISVAAVLGFLFFGIGLTSFFQGRLHKEQILTAALASESSELLKEKEVWKKRLEELAALEARAQTIIDRRPHPLPGWMLGYFGNVLPSKLTLRKAKISREDNEWKMELTGLAPNDLVLGSQTLATFEKRLQEGPYQVELIGDWRGAWLQRVSEQRQQEFSSQPREFSMVGRIKG